MADTIVGQWMSSFRVLYSYDRHNKRKVFEDGTLQVRKTEANAYSITLMNEEKKELKRTTETNIDKYQVDKEVTFGQYRVQIGHDCRSVD